MSTLVYSPGVRILIATRTGKVIDVSDDIVSGSLMLNSDAPHQLTINLTNTRRKYDGVFWPDDRIVVQMKRLRWLQVFSGYLDSVPYFNVYPSTIPLRATCTLKRLLYTLYDSGSVAFVNLWNKLNTGTATATDSDLSTRAVRILQEIGRWDPLMVHIGALPNDWFQRIQPLYTSIAEKVNSAALPLGLGSAVVGGKPVNGDLTPDGTNSLTPTQIALVAQGAGFTGDGLLAAVAICLVESGGKIDSLNTANSNGSTDRGLWQINSVHSSYDAQQLLRDPAYNAAAAFDISNGGTDFGPWSTYWSHPFTSGKSQGIYLTRLDDAKAGVQEAQTAVAVGQFAFLSPQSTRNKIAADVAGSSGAGQSNVDKFVNFALAQVGKPYVWGGSGMDSFDCSGLVLAAAATVGITMSHYVPDEHQACVDAGTVIPLEDGLRTRGALLFAEALGHVAISLGDGRMVNAQNSQVGIVIGPANWFESAALVPGLTGYVTTDGAPIANTGETGNGLVDPTLVQAYNWFVAGDPLSNVLSGPRALMNDTPVLPLIQEIMGVSQRSFCSAPNGDFIAWFPDYFGVYGQLGKIVVQDIELNDFTIMWSDRNLVTHQFVSGSFPGIGYGDPQIGVAMQSAQYQTMGIATVEFPELLHALFNVDPSDGDADFWLSPVNIIKRFGIRRNYTQMQNIGGHYEEFWWAIFLFMQSWAQQFSTTIDMTFMPEAYPGMLLQVPTKGIQMYINQVTHNFSFGGAGFTTSCQCIAPSALGASKPGLAGLIMAGDNPNFTAGKVVTTQTNPPSNNPLVPTPERIGPGPR